MEFVDITNRKWKVECMGCAIADGTVSTPGGIISANDTCYLHQDPEVPLEGFLIVATARHVQSISDLTDSEYADLTSLLRHGRRLLDSVPSLRYVTIVQEERSSHFHLWLFPWHNWMIEKYGDASLTNIRAIMKQAIERLRTPEHVKRILSWAERFRQMSVAPG